MKQLLLIIGFFIINSYSLFPRIKKDPFYINKDSIKKEKWSNKKTISLILTQTSFVNWNAGGNNSVSGIASSYIDYNYKGKQLFWNNKLISRYGINKEEGKSRVRKTDDVLEIISDFGYQRNEKSQWYNSARFNLRTQFAKGYKYNETNPQSISEFFAPAYIFLGLGTQFTSYTKKYKLYISPITNKTTLVLNQRLANKGAFGVEKAVYEVVNGERVLVKKGKNSKVEFGTLITGEFKHEIIKNIEMINKLVLYSDYVNKYGNIDIDWELRLDLKVNKYVKANVLSHILYDDDVKERDSGGPRVQFKQLLGIGVAYSF